VSGSELELNRLPSTPPAAVSVVFRQPSIASQASHTSHRVQESRHSDHSFVASIVEAFQLAHKLTDELTTLLKAQRVEAAERERALWTDALEREKLPLQQTADRVVGAREACTATRTDAVADATKGSCSTNSQSDGQTTAASSTGFREGAADYSNGRP